MKIQIGLVCAFLLTLGLPLHSAEKEHVKIDISQKQFLENNCLKCHNEKKSKGKFRVDNLSFAIDSNKTAGKWQKILNSLNAGEMPPEGKKQPEPKAKADFLDALANTMVKARKSLSDQNGVITMRRLNRREYKNTLRELLGVEINVSELPPDSGSGSFDTVGASLFMSSNQFEQYLALGKEALDEAFTWELEAAVNHKKRFEAEYLTKKYKKYVDKTADKQKRAKEWIAKFNEAAENPKNKEIYAAMKKKYKWDNKIRDKWQELPGAPDPKDFGFKAVHQINSGVKPYYKDYHEHYLTLPLAEQGAYISVPTVHPFELPTGFVEFNTPSKWPPGNYIARVRIGAKQQAPFNRKVIEFGIDAPHGKVMSTHRVTGTHEKPQIIEMPFTLTRKHKDRENRQIFIREKASDYHISHKRKFFNEEKKKNGLGPEFVLWIDWVEIERIPNDKREMPKGLKALGFSLTDDKGLTRQDILNGFINFAQLAFRNKNVSEEYIEKIFKIYESRRKDGVSHKDSLRYSLSIILSSPMFLYISEPLKGKEHKALSGEEFATRLSYFLWGSPADKQLIGLGKSGKIFDEKVLSKETERLLKDPRAKDFIHSFTYQWLGLDRLDFFQVDIKKHRTFDDSVKLAATKEIYESVKYVLKNNLSMQNLLKADYILANNVLADFYGIEGVKGDSFRYVKLPKNSPRGGLLGMAGVHLMGGNGIETSPVERGAWVLRKLLNTPPPPAPANVPMLNRLADEVVTVRERQKLHQEDPQCKSCHRKIDPIGFGLENFDAVGLWRTEDSYYPLDSKGREIKKKGKTWKIDPAGSLHRGPSFKSFFELRDIVASNTDGFTKGFCEALIEYAMGRPAGLSDENLIESLMKDSKGFKMREIILALVKSKQFRTK